MANRACSIASYENSARLTLLSGMTTAARSVCGYSRSEHRAALILGIDYLDATGENSGWAARVDEYFGRGVRAALGHGDNRA